MPTAVETAVQPRFWVPQGVAIQTDSLGFLLDPEDEFFKHANTEATELSRVRDVPCVVLLGEPGHGKSTSLREEAETLRTAGRNVLLVDLGEIGSDESLVRHAFQGGAWDLWRAGQSLVVLLDSFDECRLSVTNAAQILLRELRALSSRDRLSFRVAARSGAWPEMAEPRLREWWPDGVCILNLAPLRRKDAEAMTTERGVPEPEKLFEAVRAAGAGPLAASPISLQLLARLYQKGGGLPGRRRDLFEQGCLWLSAEHSTSRRAAGKTGMLTPLQRLAVAGRIAAITLFAGRPGVWLGDETALPDGDWLTPSDLVGGEETASGATFAVTIQAMREVLTETALFTSVGSDALRWSHRTYQEYLAARFVLNHGLPSAQLASLLRHPARVDRIVPQLRGVAAWLGQRPDVLQMLLTADPQALFEVEVESADDRRAAVDAILASARGIEISDFALTPDQYRRLTHPTLAAQVRPVIADKTANRLVRRIAIDLAEHCCLALVEDALVAVVLDTTDQHHIRASAAHSLRESSTSATQTALRGLLATDLKEDEDDELLGYALHVSWPGQLSAAAIFARLTPPKEANYHGSYAEFLLEELLPGLSEADLPTALTWAGTLSEHLVEETVFGAVCDRLVRRAWTHLEIPTVRAALAEVIRSRIIRGDRSVGGRYAEDENGHFESNDIGRRLLLHDLLALFADPERVSELLTFHPRLAHADDLHWFIEQLNTETTPGVRGMLVELVARYWQRDWPDAASMILQSVDDHPDLEARLAYAFRPVALSSAEADGMRAAYRANLELERRANPPHIPLPPVNERITPLVDRCEGGERDCWIGIIGELAADARGRWVPRDTDLTQAPGWQLLDGILRGRVCAAAGAFIAERSSRQDEWFECDRSPGRAAQAGYQAFRLLRRAAPIQYEGLSEGLWERWIPALFAVPLGGDAEGMEARRAILATAYRRSPEPFLAWLRLYILRDNARRSIVQSVGVGGARSEPTIREEMTDAPSKVHDCWGEPIAALFRDLLLDSRINDTIHLNLLDALLRREDTASIQYAEALARGEVVSGATRRRSVLLSLCILMPTRGVRLLLSLESSSPELVKSTLAAFPDTFALRRADPLLEALTEPQVASLYGLSLRLFPPPASPEPRDTRVRVGFSQVEFRDTLLRGLVTRGTFAVLTAIDSLIPHAPDSLALQFMRREAEHTALAETWAPPAPQQVMELVRNGTRRIVRSGEELMLVLIESIRRYEQELQGETPQSFTLWDQTGTTPAVIFRPKNEERFSDSLKVHLERDLQGRGIISQREVVIRSKLGTAGAPGERTDIHVTATHPHPVSGEVAAVRVIIEMKGCWHAEVLSAMETQLRDRYLRDNDCQHGLFAVGWFLCPQWDSRDSREGDARRQMPATLQDAQQIFDQQAEVLSVNGAHLRGIVINARLR